MDYTKELREFIAENFLFGDMSALQDDQSFLDSGIIDSTGMLEFISFLEKKYQVGIEPEEMVPENLDSVNRAAAFLTRKLVPVTPAVHGSSYENGTLFRGAAPN
jgi:acyl carrier protein